MSPFWILLELGWQRWWWQLDLRRAKLQSNPYRQQTNTKLFTSRMPFLLPVRALMGMTTTCTLLANQSINQSINHSVSQSVSQSVKHRCIYFRNKSITENTVILGWCFKTFWDHRPPPRPLDSFKYNQCPHPAKENFLWNLHRSASRSESGS